MVQSIRRIKFCSARDLERSPLMTISSGDFNLKTFCFWRIPELFIVYYASHLFHRERIFFNGINGSKASRSSVLARSGPHQNPLCKAQRVFCFIGRAKLAWVSTRKQKTTFAIRRNDFDALVNSKTGSCK